MKRNPLESLRDVLVTRELTPEEKQVLRSWLLAHPEQAEDWEMEEALSCGLRNLPQATPSSNFTARVLERIRLEEGAGRETLVVPGTRRLRRWWKQVSFGVVACVAMLSLGMLEWWGYRHENRAEADLQELALQILVTLPPSAAEDFESIQLLSESLQPVDVELLAALE